MPASLLQHRFTRVNDLHSALNPTSVADVLRVRTIEDLRRAIARAAAAGQSVSICGARHAMGGQQFAGAPTPRHGRARARNRLRRRPRARRGRGRHPVARAARLARTRASRASGTWTIRQKQTGADHLTPRWPRSTANAHGRGLRRCGPSSTTSRRLPCVDAAGRPPLQPDENAPLFALAIGGYGLFGAIASVWLRLSPRRKLGRVVEVMAVDGLMRHFERTDCRRFPVTATSSSRSMGRGTFLRRGVFSCYARWPTPRRCRGPARAMSPTGNG